MTTVARIPRTSLDDVCATYLLPFNGEYYNVPIENVLLYPKFTNCVPASHISRTLNSRDPIDWCNYLTSGRVLHIRGNEGSAVYTTFVASDVRNVQEQRVLHQIPHCVADAHFAQLREWELCAYPEPRNPRQNARIAVYDWRKGRHLPDHDRIDPVANGWPRADPTSMNVPVRDARSAVVPPPDPMVEYEAFLEQRARPSSTPTHARPVIHTRPTRHREPAAWEHDPWRLPPSLMQLPRQPRQLPPPAYSGRADDLRTLSEFLFEVKDMVPDGAYLEASNALQRVWDNAI